MMNKQISDIVDFSFIRYSNCWEDAEVLMKALNIDQHSKVLSVASAGDNCFALAAENPKEIIAFDLSEAQLYLTELKLEAIKMFDRETYMKFAGFRNFSDRRSLYAMIQKNLSDNCKSYWNKNLDSIKQGIIHIGKFESYFQLLKKEYLPKVHPKEILIELLRTKSEEEQKEFYHNKWETKEWIEVHNVFFGKNMLGEKGRDPEFLKEIKGSVADILLQREAAHYSTKYCQKNFLLHYMMHNNFSDPYLPYYVRKENYSMVQKNLNCITLFHGSLSEVIQLHSDCTHFNLSNIFEYMSPELFEEEAQLLLDNSAKKATYAYWNFMISRHIHNVWPKRVNYLENESKHLKKEDLGYFYSDFIINKKS